MSVSPIAKWDNEPEETPSGDLLLAKSRDNRWTYGCLFFAIAFVVSVFCYWLQSIHSRQQDQAIHRLTAEVQMLRAEKAP